MKHIVAIFFIPLFLAGCQTTSFFDNSSSADSPDIDVTAGSDSDAYYLNIAKDLYVAGQYKQSYQIASKLTENNNVEAQYLLGYLLYYGQGVPVDIKQGTKWITVSADVGYRPAIEALVMIRHGLTPDNKCSSGILIPENTKKTGDTSRDATLKLKEGEVLITPDSNNKSLEQKKSGKEKNSQDLQVNTKKSARSWNRYTIQLLSTDSEGFVTEYLQAFKEHYPDLMDFIIAFKSKNKPYTYGVGFNAFETPADADKALLKLKLRLNDSTLWIKPLQNYVPISI